ncbi:MAG TPA: cation:proton antiporter, partial [Acidimicrobiales bacterium]|nr:cation:proton antiporter [Acidimicrobiales bacterium]
GRFADPGVLALAGALLAVALIGKVVSSVAAGGGDRLLIGLGMIPRGEVGLIFATIGLRQRVFGEDVYAALLLVVLATTLLTPPALRWRLGRLRARAHSARVRPPPAEGWLLVSDQTVELAAEPPLGDALAVALEAAVACETRSPGPDLLAWLASLPPDRLPWDAAARRRFLALLSEGGPRAWRFLAVTGVLDRSLPELAEALSRRQADAGQIDPLEALRWPTVARLRELGPDPQLEHPERLLLAAVVLDATDGGLDPPVVVARRIVQRLDLGAATEQAVAGLVEDAELLPAAARRLDAVAEEPVLALATHLGSPERARAQYLLTVASRDGDAVERERLATLHELLQSALSHPELTGRAASNAIEQRRARAARLTADPAVAERIAAAPRAYVLQVEPADLARQAALCEPPPGRRSVRVSVLPEDGATRVELVAADRVGLLAAETGVLADLGLDVTAAVVATWGDGCALGSFTVAGSPPDPDKLRERLVESLDAPLRSEPRPEARIDCDNDASPWHTVCTVEAPDRLGLLHDLATAFAAAGANVHAARLSSEAGLVRDVFELTDRSGSKLDGRTCGRVATLAASGVEPSRLPWRRVRLA